MTQRTVTVTTVRTVVVTGPPAPPPTKWELAAIFTVMLLGPVTVMAAIPFVMWLTNNL